MALPGTTNPAGSYGYDAGVAPNSMNRVFLGDPYKQKALDLQEQGQNFGQDLATQQFNLKKSIYGTIAPYAQQMLAGGLGGAGAPGGAVAPQPQINQNPIYSPQQIQQQMNAAFSSNDQRTSTLMKQLQESSAARGFGGNSPAMQAQQTQLGIANNAQNALAQREIPLQYAQPNADQAFRVNQLQQQQWQGAEDSDIRRRQQQQQILSQMLGFFGGLG